jgi:hypothetical protein
MNRSTFLASIAASVLAPIATGAPAAWTRGSLEIHHLSMGRGNATLFIFPDATTLLVDAGAVRGNPALLAPVRPNPNRRPGE